MEHTASDGKTYKVEFYNLDVIISVGYRVNSGRATQFRIWATNVLKKHIINGYTLNQKRLLEQNKNQLEKLNNSVNFIIHKASLPELDRHTFELLNIVKEYTNSLTLLYQYDNGSVGLIKEKKPKFKLTLELCQDFILQIKSQLKEKGEASNLFGNEMDHKFKSVVGSLYQTFGRKELYQSIEEKAAHLLYLVIKDHPFSDGNKRIGSLLFIYFLEKNNYLRKTNGEKKISDNTLVALALLIANSNPKEKDVMTNIITNLLQ